MPLKGSRAATPTLLKQPWNKQSECPQKPVHPNYPFAIGIPPGRTWRGWDFFNTRAFDTIDKVVAVDAVAIANEKTGGFLIREDGLRVRTFGHIVAQRGQFGHDPGVPPMSGFGRVCAELDHGFCVRCVGVRVS